jgi:Flp pilus assembly protein TadD
MHGLALKIAWISFALAGFAAAPARASWLQARSEHFIVYSKDDSDASLREFATRLERFDKGMRILRKLPDTPSDHANPLTIYVLPDAAAVERLCNDGAHNAGWCTNIAGFYNGRAEGSVAFTPHRSGTGDPLGGNAQIVLFHEYTHHFMLQNYSAAYPAWFVEGFAEFNSTASFDKDGSIGFGKPALHRYYGLLSGKPLPLARMLAPDSSDLRGWQREAMYGRGWLLTHYLTFSKDRQGQLSTYISGINEGKSGAQAATAAFGDIRKLDIELDKYLRRPSLSYLRLTADTAPTGPITIRQLTPGEAAMMPVRLISKRGVDAATAARVVVDARKLAAPYPNEPGAQDALAEAEFDNGNDELAEAAADRALAANPKDRAAMMYVGRSRMRRASKAKVADPAVWKDARSWFIKANHSENDDAAPLMLFYMSFEAEGRKPTANAITGLEYAFLMAPQDPGLRWLVARQYLADGRFKEARITLAPLAFDPHATPDNQAAAIITLIDKGDAEAIATTLKKAEVPDDGS